jgi:translocator protein
MKISPLPKYSLLAVALIVIMLTTWATLAPLGGVDQAAISDRYPTSVTPAGYVFGIWSLIYASWIAVGIFALRQHHPRNHIVRIWQRWFGSREDILLTDEEQIYHMSAMTLTAIWLIPWHFAHIGISVIVMIMILGVLVRLFQISRRAPRWFHCAVQLFLGWILIATLANISVWAVANNWISSDSQLWAILVFGLGFAINMYTWIRYKTWTMM